MNVETLKNLVGQPGPEGKVLRFKTATRPALTKKNRTTKEPTNFTVEARSSFTAVVGANYADLVNRKLQEDGKPAEFKAAKPTGKHHVDGLGWLLESDANPGTFYVSLSCIGDRQTEYFVDGEKAGAERVADLWANYLPKQGRTASVEWKTYSIDSILSAEPV